MYVSSPETSALSIDEQQQRVAGCESRNGPRELIDIESRHTP